MPIYRVTLRNPSIQGPVSQTVGATNPDVATGYAYANIKAQAPFVPSLSQCQVEVVPSGTNRLLGDAATTPAQQTYIKMLQDRIAVALPQVKDRFRVILNPSGFHYAITCGDSQYNNISTWKEVDSQLETDSEGYHDLISAAFSNFYCHLLQSTIFSFSTADQKVMLDEEDKLHETLVPAVLQAFISAGFSFPATLPAGCPSKLQYVLQQVSLLDQKTFPTYYRDLNNAIDDFLHSSPATEALKARRDDAGKRLKAAITNITSASGDNGGEQVGNNAYVPGYSMSLDATQIRQGLLNVGSNIAIALKMSNFSSDRCNLTIAGGTSFSMPIAGLLEFRGSGSASYNLSRYTSSSSDVTISITYPGLTVVDVTPMPLLSVSNNLTGWYDNDMLQEIAAKTGKDVTGCHLATTEFSVSDVFGIDKRMARLKTLVISQQPTMTITMNNVDVSRLTTDLQVNARVDVDLFGLFPIGSAASSYSVQKVEGNSTNTSVNITLAPPQPGTEKIPEQDRVAYLIGGIASFPPDNA